MPECGDFQRKTLPRVSEDVAAEPFRPFRIRMASGQTYDIRHPAMILAGKTIVRIYRNLDADQDRVPQGHELSMILIEARELNESRTAAGLN